MITFDIPKARSQANTIENLAGTIEQLANSDFNSAIQSLSGGWKGASADKFYTKAGKVKSKISDDAREMRTTTAFIRTAISRAEWAEEMAKQIASIRLW